jgi:tRNA(Arg) A34 adenosine deaminase TadA
LWRLKKPEHYMQYAIAEAVRAKEQGGVGIGAVLVAGKQAK